MDSVFLPIGLYVVPPPPLVYRPARRMPKSDRSYPRSKAPSPVAAHGERPEPTRSKAVKTAVRTGPVEQKSEAKLKAAQAKADKLAVLKLTQQDIDGLSREQLKQLRGY
jgi:hypothetical protein